MRASERRSRRLELGATANTRQARAANSVLARDQIHDPRRVPEQRRDRGLSSTRDASLWTSERAVRASVVMRKGDVKEDLGCEDRDYPKLGPSA